MFKTFQCTIVRLSRKLEHLNHAVCDVEAAYNEMHEAAHIFVRVKDRVNSLPATLIEARKVALKAQIAGPVSKDGPYSVKDNLLLC